MRSQRWRPSRPVMRKLRRARSLRTTNRQVFWWSVIMLLSSREGLGHQVCTWFAVIYAILLFYMFYVSPQLLQIPSNQTCNIDTWLILTSRHWWQPSKTSATNGDCVTLGECVAFWKSPGWLYQCPTAHGQSSTLAGNLKARWSKRNLFDLTWFQGEFVVYNVSVNISYQISFSRASIFVKALGHLGDKGILPGVL